MKTIPNILLLLFSIVCFSQENNHLVVDAITKEFIPYCTIKILKTNTGFYTNSNGFFQIELLDKKDIELSHIGYENQILKHNNIPDTILLNPRTVLLDEIIVSNRSTKNKQKTIGYIKKSKNLFWHIEANKEIATKIVLANKYKDSYIEKILIPINKSGLKKINRKWKRVSPNFESVFFINLYNSLDNKPSSSALTKPITVTCNQNSEEIIVVDITDEYIKMPTNGIFIGIQMIGDVNKLGTAQNNLETQQPSFVFTKKNKKDIKSSTYLKNVFSNDGSWVLLDKSTGFIFSDQDYNLAISIQLSMHEK